MKIGQFVTIFPSGNHNEKIYGSTRAAYDLSLNLAKRGNRITAFATSDNFHDEIEYHDNLKICRYGSQLRLFSTRFSLGIFNKPISDDFDIVHVHFDIPPTPFAGLRVAKKTKKPLVVTYHGDWDETYGNLLRKIVVSYFNKYYVDKLLVNADIIISPSKHYIDESKFLKKYSHKVVVIPNGVNKDQFDNLPSKEKCRETLKIPTSCKLILYLGALTPRKGPDVLLNSLNYIIKKIPDIKLIFVGDGSYKTELRTMTHRLELDNYVDFVGYVDEKIKPYYYKAADVFVLPSTISTEVFPLVLLEAMASSVPIVTSDLHTFKSIIVDDENGLISTKGDPNDLSMKITSILENIDLRSELISNGLKFAEKYSWEQIAIKTEAVYKELLT